MDPGERTELWRRLDRIEGLARWCVGLMLGVIVVGVALTLFIASHW